MSLLKRLALSWRLTRTRLRLDSLERKRKKSLRTIRESRQDLVEWEARLNELVQANARSLEEAAEIHQQCRKEIDAAQRELEVMRRTEQTLVAANQTMLSRWKAETAIHTIRERIRQEPSE